MDSHRKDTRNDTFRILFGLWTIAVALTVSAVAAYYSVVGLTAIFAAATIPIIIMGVALETAKITVAVWLHSFWSHASLLVKIYLLNAVGILMIVTSMGIFGFLSKAHIEQAAGSTELAAQIERIESNIDRQNQIIQRAEKTIEDLEAKSARDNETIRQKIADQERIIANIYKRLERDIAIQQRIIDENQKVPSSLQSELDRINKQSELLQKAQESKDIRTIQTIIGAKVDGIFGNETRRRLTEYIEKLNDQRVNILSQVDKYQKTESPQVKEAREEIKRLQRVANEEIANATKALNIYRDKSIENLSEDNSSKIAEQEQSISKANDEIDRLLTKKYELEHRVRKIEVEVGPVKYIADLIYDSTDKKILEDVVRWVILMIVIVFDPLAIVMVIAGISILVGVRRYKSFSPVEYENTLINDCDHITGISLRPDDHSVTQTHKKSDTVDDDESREIQPNEHNQSDIEMKNNSLSDPGTKQPRRDQSDQKIQTGIHVVKIRGDENK